MKYKLQIKKELEKNCWEIKQIQNGPEWWNDENWIIETNIGIKLKDLYIYFILDPMDEKSVAEVKATYKTISSRNEDQFNIALLQMSKGKFNEKLKEFVNQLNQFRTTQLT